MASLCWMGLLIQWPYAAYIILCIVALRLNQGNKRVEFAIIYVIVLQCLL